MTSAGLNNRGHREIPLIEKHMIITASSYELPASSENGSNGVPGPGWKLVAGSYLMRTREPRTRCVLSVLRKRGMISSISSKYDDSAGVLSFWL